MKRIIFRITSIALITAFTLGQASTGFAFDNLAASCVSDHDLVPARALRVRYAVAGALAPTAIGNGSPLLNLIQGKLPKRTSISYETSTGSTVQRLREAIEIAISQYHQVKAVALDVDGTLNDRYNEIPLKNIGYIIKLLKLKIHVVLISGRRHESMYSGIVKHIVENPEVADEDLRYLDVYVNNGGCGYSGVNFPNGLSYYETKIDERAREDLDKFFRQKGWDNRRDLMVGITEYKVNIKMKEPTTEGMLALYTEIADYLEDKHYPVVATKSSNAIEVNPIGIDKGTALKDVKGRLGLKDREIIKIGDQGQKDGNDESLLTGINSLSVDEFNPENPNQIPVAEILGVRGGKLLQMC